MNARFRKLRRQVAMMGAIGWGIGGAVLGATGVLEGKLLGPWTVHLGAPGIAAALHGVVYGAVLGAAIAAFNITMAATLGGKAR